MKCLMIWGFLLTFKKKSVPNEFCLKFVYFQIVASRMMILGQPQAQDLVRVLEAVVMEPVASQVAVTLTLDLNRALSQSLSQTLHKRTKFKQNHRKLMELR